MALEYSSKDLSHLGLVAGMCDKLELVSELDRLLPSEHSLSNGTCVKALILNGLGFVERRLYLVPQFFEDKPVSHLLGEGIEAPMLNDDRLGRCLDALYESGVSELFAHLSGRAAKILGLDQAPGWGFGHLDNTRFHVDGAYNRALDGEQVEDCLHICQGYSRDHRPDLNQVMLQLVVEHSAGIPLQMAALSGNSHDGVSFRQTISDYIGALDQQAEKRCWVMDSAFYNAQTIEMVGQQSYWISRVPATLAEVQSLKAQIGQAQMLCFEDERLGAYRYTPLGNAYGGVARGVADDLLAGGLRAGVENLSQKVPMGKFILASNETQGRWSAQEKFLAYRNQAQVEKGFRFLKDKQFAASSIFVKKPERVEAILMIMGLCLLVYAALERECRNQLRKSGQSLPNQLKKPVQNPTMRWVFALMKGIHGLYLQGQEKPLILNLSDLHQQIIAIFGEVAKKYYQIE